MIVKNNNWNPFVSSCKADFLKKKTFSIYIYLTFILLKLNVKSNLLNKCEKLYKI